MNRSTDSMFRRPRGSGRPIGCITAVVLALAVVSAPAVLSSSPGMPDSADPEKIGGKIRTDDPRSGPADMSEGIIPGQLFIVRSVSPTPGTENGIDPAMEGLIIHEVRDGAYVVSGSTAALRALAFRGYSVRPLLEMPAVESRDVREWSWIGDADPGIAAMVEQVEWEAVKAKIQWLVEFKTRHSMAPNHHLVASSIDSLFTSYGLDSEMQWFEYFESDMWNIEATQTGMRYPDSYVIICGHYDSTSKTPRSLAPGADDNGTGAATVLTAAEILSKHDFEYSIRYICFDAEELGLVGSRLYANLAHRHHTKIVAVLNFDMMGYWKPGVEMDLEIEANHASQWLAEAVVNATELYTSTPYELHIYDDAWWGDHYHFWVTGYSALNHEEAWDWYDPDFNPCYHSTADRIDLIDPGFTVGNIKVGVASLATLARYIPPIEVSFDVRPGSCRNPINPKSRGVVHALVLGSEDLDVRDIDTSSLLVAGVVSASKVHPADIASSGDATGSTCADMTPDGWDDLFVELSTEALAAALGPVAKGDEAVLVLTGRLFDGREIEGTDTVMIVGRDDRASMASGTKEPATFRLYQNSPNPFNPATAIRFYLPREAHVKVTVLDVTGGLVANLADSRMSAGRKEISWTATDDVGRPLASGVYFCRLEADGSVHTKKMLLLK